MIKIAINGFGRIGRNIVRALYENPSFGGSMEIVAINDLSDIKSMAHLLKHDSVHGFFPHDVEVEENTIKVSKSPIKIFQEKNPEDLPWGEMDVDVVMECTGLFTARSDAEKHIKAGAKKVLISAPGKDVDRTVVYGVNEWSLKKDDVIVSNASCTTNCLATILKVLNDNFVVNKGTMITIHSYTGDQSMVDTYHKDLYRARAGAMSMIPTTTGAATAIGDVIPDLKGKMNGFAMRVPTPNVSFVDLVCELNRDVSVEDIINTMEKESQRRLKETLGFNSEKLVSIDFNHSPFSAVFDANQIYKIDNLYKITAWYDNEWGFSNRMLNVAKLMGSKED